MASSTTHKNKGISQKNSKRWTNLALGSVASFVVLASLMAVSDAKTPWPKYGEKPDTDTPEVKAWVKEVDWTKVPNLPVRKTKSPGDPPECPSNVAKGDCWWTCTGCYHKDDIVDCPGKKQWGLTFDDGPEPGTTEDLLELLNEKNATATFFVTGMKSAKAPKLLQMTLDKGHHLASHTWSHSGLTTLTNAEIVAELKWTEKYIFEHTGGYRVKYYRPPYGDVDNRVRAIAAQLGYKTVIWSDHWDTNDWQLEEKTITQKQIKNIFNTGIKSVPKRAKGVITLEHDGDPKYVAMARTLLDMGKQAGLQPMDIGKCLNDAMPYQAIPKPKVVAVVPPKPVAVAPKPAPAPAPAKKPEMAPAQPQPNTPPTTVDSDNQKEEEDQSSPTEEQVVEEESIKGSIQHVSSGLSTMRQPYSGLAAVAMAMVAGAFVL